jgi:hypothetical protein
LRLAEKFQLQVFTVEPFSNYLDRLSPEEAPLLHTFASMDMDEGWLLRSPTVMHETFHGFQAEGFDLIVEDLLTLPSDPPVIAEGFKLLPRLVAPLLDDRHHQAIWLLPTAEFRRKALESRGSTWDIPNKTSDPELAREKLFARDQMFTDAVTEEAQRLGLPVLEMDGTRDAEGSARLVAETLDLT